MTGPGGREAELLRPAASCPWCGAPALPGDRFCETCGAELHPSDAGPAGEPCPGCGRHAAADDGYCRLCGVRRPGYGDHVEVVVPGGAAVSDVGHVRAHNEDAVALGTDVADGLVVAVVCDGVSSVRASELAARSAADATLAHLLDGAGHHPDGEHRVRAAVAAGAVAAAGVAPAGSRHPPSSTLVCALVDLGDPTAPVVTVGWVGDSRAYWLAGRGEAQLLTADHVAATAPPGTVDPVVAAARPDAITRWLGGDGDAEPDVVVLEPSDRGLLLLCTDGLWKYLPDAADLAAVALPALHDGGPPTAAAALTAAALAAGGEDNVTVAVVPVLPVPVPGSRSSS